MPGADDIKPPLVPIGLHGAVLWRAGPRVVADGVVAGTLTTPGLIPASPKRTLRDYAGALDSRSRVPGPSLFAWVSFRVLPWARALVYSKVGDAICEVNVKVHKTTLR